MIFNNSALIKSTGKKAQKNYMNKIIDRLDHKFCFEVFDSKTKQPLLEWKKRNDDKLTNFSITDFKYYLNSGYIELEEESMESLIRLRDEINKEKEELETMIEDFVKDACEKEKELEEEKIICDYEDHDLSEREKKLQMEKFELEEQNKRIEQDLVFLDQERAKIIEERKALKKEKEQLKQEKRKFVNDKMKENNKKI